MIRYSPFIFLFTISQFLYGCKNEKVSLTSIKLSIVDTIEIPYTILHTNSVFNSEYNTQVNHYFVFNDKQIVFFYCIDSITPTTKFNITGLVNNYFAINKDLLIVNYSNSIQHYYILNQNSEIIDTLKEKIKDSLKMDCFINTFYYQFCIKQKNGEYHFFTDLFHILNQKNEWETRKKRYSFPVINKLIINEHQISYNNAIGKYPCQFSSKKGMYMYSNFVSMNKNHDFIFSFFEIDSLFIIKQNNITEKVYFKSKYKEKPFDFPDSLDYNDQYILNQIASENTSYTYNYYDSYRDQYYIIVNHPMKYENEDGTLNDLSKCPWSIIVLNKDFIQIDEIDMPINLNKHLIFIVPEGLAINDYILNEQEPNKTVFVVYKIQKYD